MTQMAENTFQVKPNSGTSAPELSSFWKAGREPNCLRWETLGNRGLTVTDSVNDDSSPRKLDELEIQILFHPFTKLTV